MVVLLPAVPSAIAGPRYRGTGSYRHHLQFTGRYGERASTGSYRYPEERMQDSRSIVICRRRQNMQFTGT
jgi:hypothetical protein